MTQPTDLFGSGEDLSPSEDAPQKNAPLAARMRPRTLEEFVGQEHILGPEKLLTRAIKADRISSIILYGPPGTGKTTLAGIIAEATQSRFEKLNAVEASIADIRKILASAKNRATHSGAKTILFIDEIHRFNKSQQDVLLPDVESGMVRLIGATTHNPYFYVNTPLVSRSQVFQLEPLSVPEICTLLRRSLTDPRGMAPLLIKADDDALAHLAEVSDGDGRKALNSLEIGVLTTAPGPDEYIHITRAVAEESIQRKAVQYDADGDQHYDTISAFIKSMRGSDPDAALYWLAKMLVAGEDIRFIARRIVICAAEDVGMADPQALVVAVAAQQAVEFVGMPEARIPMCQAVLYISTAPKSNTSITSIDAAMKDINEGRTLEVPRPLRDGHYKGAENLQHGKGYKYAHDDPSGYIPQDHLPEHRQYYFPTGLGLEKKIQERLEIFRQRRASEGKGKDQPAAE
ncbi:MAG: replication-associated recombination protein A [Verrucomicrobiota bacterium]|nr:replication-associated recombination protein A [Verrucomicrobiota bacterium]